MYFGIVDRIHHVVCLNSLTDIYLLLQVDNILISNDILLGGYSMISKAADVFQQNIAVVYLHIFCFLKK